MASASISLTAKARAPQTLAKPTLMGGVGDLDAAVSLRLHALFLPVPRLLLKALEVAGDGRIWLPVPISLLLISTTTSSRVSPLLVGLVVGLVLDISIVGLAKVIVRRPRPAYNAKDMYVAVSADHWSFPSGHSSRAFLVASFLAAGGLPREVLFLWAAATSASRVLLGRHYVLDVVAGAWLGLLEAWLSTLILRFICGRSSFLVLLLKVAEESNVAKSWVSVEWDVQNRTLTVSPRPILDEKTRKQLWRRFGLFCCKTLDDATTVHLPLS